MLTNSAEVSGQHQNAPTRCILVGFLLLLGAPAALVAQTPGQRVPPRDLIHAEFIANIMDGIQKARENWSTALGADELDPLMDLYAPDAMVIPPGGQPLYGRDAIRAYWSEALPAMGTMQTGLSDIDASGQMAMVGGSYSVEWTGPTQSQGPESGGLLTVFLKEGGRWVIRAQVFTKTSSP